MCVQVVDLLRSTNRAIHHEYSLVCKHGRKDYYYNSYMLQIWFGVRIFASVGVNAFDYRNYKHLQKQHKTVRANPLKKKIKNKFSYTI